MSANATQAATTSWNIDPAHTTAEFKVKHMMITNVKGQFSAVTGVVEIDPEEVANSHVEVSIDASSISTRDAQRDAHLKSPDFFDVEKFPTLSFASTRVTRKDDGDLAVESNLTIHGVTRKVVFEAEGPSEPAKDPWGNVRIGWSASTKINRKDFGLNWNAALEAGGLLVGDQVTITLDAQAVKA